jgi:hypothetical protein
MPKALSGTVVSGSWVQGRGFEESIRAGAPRFGVSRGARLSMFFCSVRTVRVVPRSRRGLGSCSGRLDRGRAWKPTEVPLNTNQSCLH